MKVLLFGPPGAGKGTQAKIVAKKLEIPHISTGDLLRKTIRTGSKLGLQIKELLDKGEFVTDEMINSLVKETLLEYESFILDGYPRTLQQAEFLKKIFDEKNKKIDAAIFIDAPLDMLLKRITNRRVCPVCGRVYNLISHPPKKECICDDDGTQLVHRDDDKEDVVKERYNIYLERTAPVIEFYKKNYKIFTVDGSQDIEDVTKELFNILKGVSSNDNN
ncbi:adenylate kinase [Tepiditoga spiralis]|uniref:Adenylate kinase n=1 Tax=Tepiditoga spiralis TaxID=2108365 RepID=A0A7G1G7K4_9BACT|nr:adenylate kinase [Tepiditoga spiralis]BBE30917.1 adenylate kinase [Tepiditoga spiralis]